MSVGSNTQKPQASLSPPFINLGPPCTGSTAVHFEVPGNSYTQRSQVSMRQYSQTSGLLVLGFSEPVPTDLWYLRSVGTGSERPEVCGYRKSLNTLTPGPGLLHSFPPAPTTRVKPTLRYPFRWLSRV